MRQFVLVAVVVSGCSHAPIAEVPGRVRWWVKYESEPGKPAEGEIGRDAGAVPVPAGVTDAQCSYDAVGVEGEQEVRWLRCVAPTWYSSTIASCRTSRVTVGGPLSESDLAAVVSQRDVSVMLLKGIDQKQFGVGLRCETGTP